MFKNTQQAVYAGLKFSDEDRVKVSALRKVFDEKFRIALDKNNLDLAMVFATKSQLCREADEAREIIMTHPTLF